MLFNKYRERIKTALNKEKLVRFFDKQGFYIVLFICISIIGITALLTYGREVSPQDGVGGDKTSVEEMADGDLLPDAEGDGGNLGDIDIEIKDVITNTEEAEEAGHPKPGSADNIEAKSSDGGQASSDGSGEIAQKGNEGAPIIGEDKEKLNKDESKQKSIDAKPVISEQRASKLKMVYPVRGELLRPYAMDELVYSNTLKEWTTHPGMDIETFLGAEVKAAMSGIVEEIVEDPLMGIMITIDHGDGIKTRYANLSTANMVVEGQEVKAGQVISGVGRTAGTEILDPSHLHFELIINGSYANPAEYLE